MPTSSVIVNSNGSPASGIKVSLSISGSGVTPNVYTDRSGKAIISHEASGTATIFVNGMNRGTMRVPGTSVIEK